ncbi:MAG: hypothetical protein ABSH49_23590 [Bryobacteraceae bacterium]|jgi:hypothetical protein
MIASFCIRFPKKCGDVIGSLDDVIEVQVVTPRRRAVHLRAAKIEFAV